jgi:hypothetical protein
MKAIMHHHIVGGVKSGIIVGVITGIIKGISLLGLGFFLTYIPYLEFHHIDSVDLPIILISVLAAGYCGIVGGLVLGFSLGLFYSTRGYLLAQTNLDIMYFALLCAIFFFGVIEIKLFLDWLPSDITITSGVFWSSTLVLFTVSYMLYRFIRWTMHSIFLARLSFLLFYRRALYFSSAILGVASFIWLITPIR